MIGLDFAAVPAGNSAAPLSEAGWQENIVKICDKSTKIVYKMRTVATGQQATKAAVFCIPNLWQL